TGTAAGAGRVWDAATLAPAFTLEGGAVGTGALAFSPDSRSLAACRADGVTLWDVPGGQRRRPVAGHVGEVTHFDFSPDGALLAPAQGDTTARLWDVSTGQERRVLRGHTAAVTQVAFSPDGERLASGGRDGSARVWDLTADPESGLVQTQYGIDNVEAIA